MAQFRPSVFKAAVLVASLAGASAHAQVAVTCNSPLGNLASGPGAWSIAQSAQLPDRTTPPPNAPPTSGYQPAVTATPLNTPPAPPVDPEGYRWDPSQSWISLSNTGQIAHVPHHYFVRQQITLGSEVDLGSLALTYNVSVDDELWAVYINGQQVQAGSPLLVGFAPAAADGYRTTQPLAVTLDQHWQRGVNEIVFAVYDFGGNMGFAASAIDLRAQCSPNNGGGATPVAVPANDWRGLALLSMLLAGAGLWHRKRRN